MTQPKKGCSTNRSSLFTTAQRNPGLIENSPSTSLLHLKDPIGQGIQGVSLNHTVMPTSASSIKNHKKYNDKRQSFDVRFNKSSFTAQKTNSGSGKIETFNAKLGQGIELDLLDKERLMHSGTHLAGVTNATAKATQPKKIFIGSADSNAADADKAVTPRNLKTQVGDLIN